MIKITNGVDTLLVPNGAYKSQYQPNGWRPVDGEKVPSEAPAKPSKTVSVPEGVNTSDEYEAAESANEGVEEDVCEIEDIDSMEPEKPLSEMTSGELKRKAKSLGIDISEMTSKKQVRDAIAEAIAE